MLGDGEAPAEEVERVYAWFCRERGDVSHFHAYADSGGWFMRSNSSNSSSSKSDASLMPFSNSSRAVRATSPIATSFVAMA